MSKNLLGSLVAVIAIGLIAGLILINKSDDDAASNKPVQPASSSQQTTESSNNSAQPAAEPTTPSQQTSEVEIEDFNFRPNKITIKKGTTVTWTNKDTTKHDVTPDTESPDFKASELFGKGESYSFTFNKIGTYSYHCSPHPYMKATIEVTQ